MSTAKQLLIFWRSALPPSLGPSTPGTARLLEPDNGGRKILPNVQIYLPINKALQSRNLGSPLQNNLLTEIKSKITH
jgi:hypothetical protein